VGRENSEYEFQVQFYAWALEKIAGEAVRGRILYLRPGEPIVHEVDVSNVSTAIGDVVLAMACAVQAAEFGARPGDVCQGCRVRAGCPHGF